MQSHKKQKEENKSAEYCTSFFKKQTSDSKSNSTKKSRSRIAFSTNATPSLELPKTSYHIRELKSPSEEKMDYLAYGITLVKTWFNEQEVKPEVPDGKPRYTVTKLAKPLNTLIESLQAEIKDRPKEIDELFLKEIDLLGDQIKEHAARRVDLFFYLLVAVYGKNVAVNKEHTEKQHGKGSTKRGTQAAHSSLFPCVSMTGLPRGWSCGAANYPSLTFKGTHFDEVLNMTVELPIIVNVLDHHLEWSERSDGFRCKKSEYAAACLAILNRAARSELNPIDGMNEFLKVMHDFFSQIENDYIKNNKGTHKAMEKVYEYEREGTFLAANKDNSINMDYIHLMLQVPAAHQSAKWVPSVIQNQYLKPFYARTQGEIFSSAPVKGRGKKAKRNSQ